MKIKLFIIYFNISFSFFLCISLRFFFPLKFIPYK